MDKILAKWKCRRLCIMTFQSNNNALDGMLEVQTIIQEQIKLVFFIIVNSFTSRSDFNY